MFGLSNEIIANIIGAIGLVIFFLSFQFKSRKSLIVIQTIALVVFTTQYFVLGAVAGVVTEIICIIRNIVFYFKKKNKILDTSLAIGFIALNVLISCILFKLELDTFSWTFFIVILAFSLQTVGLLVENNKINRHLFLLVSPLWIVYNVYNHAYFAAITDSLNILSIVIFLVRLVIESKKSNENEQKA